jgi:DNA-binding transcriptional ArsR family regulator
MLNMLQVIAEPRRQQILRLVWTHERAASEIANRMDVTFGAVSQHLKVLHDAGAVSVRREGRFRYYQAQPEALGSLATHLTAMWSTKLMRLKRLAEAEERHRG